MKKGKGSKQKNRYIFCVHDDFYKIYYCDYCNKKVKACSVGDFGSLGKICSSCYYIYVRRTRKRQKKGGTDINNRKLMSIIDKLSK